MRVSDWSSDVCSSYVDLDDLRTQRRKIGFLLLRLQLRFFARGNLGDRRDHHDIALLAHAETIRTQDDVERLIPGYVLQTHRDVALHLIADHNFGANLQSTRLNSSH